MLRSLGCLRRSSGQGLVEQEGDWAPTNAGVLLFAEEPQRFIGQAEVACVHFKGTDVVTYLDRRDLRGPLYQLVDNAEQFIYRHMPALSTLATLSVNSGEVKIGRRIEGFVGVEYREYPAEAVREAIVNPALSKSKGPWCTGTIAGAGNGSGSSSLRLRWGQRFDDRIEATP